MRNNTHATEFPSDASNTSATDTRSELNNQSINVVGQTANQIVSNTGSDTWRIAFGPAEREPPLEDNELTREVEEILEFFAAIRTRFSVQETRARQAARAQRFNMAERQRQFNQQNDCLCPDCCSNDVEEDYLFY